jgi:hypothetical protein
MNMKKKCSKCGVEKNTSEFHRDKRCKDGLYSHCKECAKEYTRKYAKENRVRLKQLQKEWRERNKEKIKQWNADFKSAQSDYVKEYNRIYQLDRYHSIPKIKLHNNVACMVRLALRGKKAGNVLETILGYTTEDLMRHIENQFDDKMTWDNYGEYWHIDHVKPQSLFNFESFEEDEFKECWGLNNLQPLSAKENRKKSNKYRSEI